MGHYVRDTNVFSSQAPLAPAPSPPRGVGVPPAPAPSPGSGRLGRNLTYEEAMAQDLLRRNQTASGGNQLLQRGGGGDEVKVIRKPWLDLPAGGQPFTYMNTGEVVLPAQTATVAVVTFQVPRRKNGAIEFIANQFIGGGWTEGTGDLVWQITADGQPIQGFESIIASLGSMANPGDYRGSPIRVFENQVIRLTLQNVGIALPADQPLLGLMRGHFYPLEQEGTASWV